MSWRTLRIVLATVGIVAVAVGLLWISQGSGRREPGWGSGELKVAEQAYYEGRVEDIIRSWQGIARHGGRDATTGRVTEPGFVSLAIDTTERAIWIEYAAARVGFCSEAGQPKLGLSPEFRENEAAWARIVKRLYQEIDRQVQAQGFTLGSLKVMCEPDR